jgi:predicted secreted protein
MEYTESANGTTASQRVGDEFQIVLPEARTAGYRWMTALKGEPSCVLLAEQHNASGQAGGSGTHVWHFKAAEVGFGKIELHYARPWAKIQKPDKSFTVEVQVRP